MVLVRWGNKSTIAVGMCVLLVTSVFASAFLFTIVDAQKQDEQDGKAIVKKKHGCTYEAIEYQQKVTCGNIEYEVLEKKVDGKNDIFYTEITPNAAGSEINLSSELGDSINPAVVVSASMVNVVWQSKVDGKYDIFYTKITNEGVATKINLSDNTGNSTNPKIDVSQGKVYVAWQDNTSGNDEIFLRIGDVDGDFSIVTRTVSNTAGQATLSYVAALGPGVIGWKEPGPPEVSYAKIIKSVERNLTKGFESFVIKTIKKGSPLEVSKVRESDFGLPILVLDALPEPASGERRHVGTAVLQVNPEGRPAPPPPIGSGARPTYLFQSGMAAATFNRENGTVKFYDPNYDNRANPVIEEWYVHEGDAPDRLPLGSGTIGEYVQEEAAQTITKSYSSSSGGISLAVKYVFGESDWSKHNITLHKDGTGTFMIEQNWYLRADKIRTADNMIQDIPESVTWTNDHSPASERLRWFEFQSGDHTVIAEYTAALFDNFKSITLQRDSTNLGFVNAAFMYGPFNTSTENPNVQIDPKTCTATGTAAATSIGCPINENGYIYVSPGTSECPASGSGASRDVASSGGPLRVRVPGSGVTGVSCARTYIEWNINDGFLGPGDDVTDVKVTFYISGISVAPAPSPNNCDYNDIVLASPQRPSGTTPSTLWERMDGRNGVYVDNDSSNTCESTGSRTALSLTDTADADVENNLALTPTPACWFAVAVKFDGGTNNQEDRSASGTMFSNARSKMGGGGPVVTIEYSDTNTLTSPC